VGGCGIERIHGARIAGTVPLHESRVLAVGNRDP
jgi:hypothetical protein